MITLFIIIVVLYVKYDSISNFLCGNNKNLFKY